MATGVSIPLRGLEGVPGLPGAPQDEAGLTRKFAGTTEGGVARDGGPGGAGMTVACWAPLSTGFSRQEYWSQLPFPLPGDIPNPED